MINNYLHDLATGILFGCVMVLYYLGKIVKQERKEELNIFYKNIFNKISKIASFALMFILIGGVPRVIYFREYEWWDAIGKGIVTALIVKHVLFFCAVIISVSIWYRTKKSLNL